MCARGSADAGAYTVQALGWKGCLTVTICVATAIVVMRIDVLALFTMAANKQVEAQQNRWAATLASDLITQAFWQKAPQVVASSFAAALPMLTNR
jgi:hypothetical protein